MTSTITPHRQSWLHSSTEPNTSIHQTSDTDFICEDRLWLPPVASQLLSDFQRRSVQRLSLIDPVSPDGLAKLEMWLEEAEEADETLIHPPSDFLLAPGDTSLLATGDTSLLAPGVSAGDLSLIVKHLNSVVADSPSSPYNSASSFIPLVPPKRTSASLNAIIPDIDALLSFSNSLTYESSFDDSNDINFHCASRQPIEDITNDYSAIDDDDKPISSFVTPRLMKTMSAPAKPLKGPKPHSITTRLPSSQTHTRESLRSPSLNQPKVSSPLSRSIVIDQDDTNLVEDDDQSDKPERRRLFRLTLFNRTDNDPTSSTALQSPYKILKSWFTRSSTHKPATTEAHTRKEVTPLNPKSASPPHQHSNPFKRVTLLQQSTEVSQPMDRWSVSLDWSSQQSFADELETYSVPIPSSTIHPVHLPTPPITSPIGPPAVMGVDRMDSILNARLSVQEGLYGLGSSEQSVDGRTLVMSISPLDTPQTLATDSDTESSSSNDSSENDAVVDDACKSCEPAYSNYYEKIEGSDDWLFFERDAKLNVRAVYQINTKFI